MRMERPWVPSLRLSNTRVGPILFWNKGITLLPYTYWLYTTGDIPSMNQ